MRKMIVAVSPDGVIGAGGGMLWHYPADLKRFKRLTLGHTVIMGRVTWASLPRRPLPERRNIVITARALEGVETFPDLASALHTTEGEVWFIGGAQLYAEAMRYTDEIDVTWVPDRVEAEDAVYFPEIDPDLFEPGPRAPLEDDPRLEHQVFRRRRFA